jgi:hypothetical protein
MVGLVTFNRRKKKLVIGSGNGSSAALSTCRGEETPKFLEPVMDEDYFSYGLGLSFFELDHMKSLHVEE